MSREYKPGRRRTSDSARKRDFAEAVIRQTTSEASAAVMSAQLAATRLQRALYRVLGGIELGHHVPNGEIVSLDVRAGDVREAQRAIDYCQDKLPALKDYTDEAYRDTEPS